MRILFRYEYMHRIYPCCILATCIYYDPEDSTLCISDGIDWWEFKCHEMYARTKIDSAFGTGNLDMERITFQLCK